MNNKWLIFGVLAIIGYSMAGTLKKYPLFVQLNSTLNPNDTTTTGGVYSGS